MRPYRPGDPRCSLQHEDCTAGLSVLDVHSFAGKKIIPFCTAGVSGVEKAAEHIQSLVGADVIVDAGKRLGADGSEEEVRIWTELLGL